MLLLERDCMKGVDGKVELDSGDVFLIAINASSQPSRFQEDGRWIMPFLLLSLEGVGGGHIEVEQMGHAWYVSPFLLPSNFTPTRMSMIIHITLELRTPHDEAALSLVPREIGD